MKKYLVGGAVRDTLLQRKNVDQDWVLTGATADDLLTQGYQQVGQSFAVFLHPKTSDEHALAVNVSGISHPDTTIEEDLARRDLTINAMAQDENGHVIDPFAGQQDLHDKIIRHVSAASFRQDPIRLLRTARFAARYHGIGFSIASSTLQLMTTMVDEGDLDKWVAERVWAEFAKALAGQNTAIFIQVLQDCGALSKIMPEVSKLFGVPQSASSHPEIDTGIHSLLVLSQAEKLSANIDVRFAALLHDLGKGSTPPEHWPKHPGHEARGVQLVKAACNRLKPPNQCIELAQLAASFHTHVHRLFQLTAEDVLSLLEQSDAFRRRDRFEAFLLVCKADSRGRYGYEDERYPQQSALLNWLIHLEQHDYSDIYLKLSGLDIKQHIHQRRLSGIEALIAQHGMA
ncbi:MAG: multifunctional CCA addition/repair protein [Methylococcales bacterium]|nr:multifunctional CCA addition/repair protein [Methylococcales bacterium]MBT7444313.1 multifunctional CCA addition/repair protein [Methylococcales bacterium]